MLTITDMTLCELQLDKLPAQHVRAFYRALLDIGVSRVQIPRQALPILGDSLILERSVLAVDEEDTCIPEGFCGYISANNGKKGMTVCETCISETPPTMMDEVRYIADEHLFMQNYADAFRRLLALKNASFCAKNADYAGTALTVEWVLAGGQSTAVSFLGTGGYAPLEQVLAALHVAGHPLPGIHLSKLALAAKEWGRMTGQQIPIHSPVLGAHLFDVESGIHVDGLLKNRRCYEPFAPEEVGATRRIRIGKHSGKRALAMKLKELGMKGEYDLDCLLEKVRQVSIQNGGSLDDVTFAALAKRVKEGDAA